MALRIPTRAFSPRATAQPDQRSSAAVTVVWVVLLNKPFYPIYVWYLTGEGFFASLGTLLAVPLYIGALLMARHSGLVTRVALVLIGTVDTFFETKLFGQSSGTELFFAACIMLVAVLFTEREAWWQRGLAATVFAAFVVSRSFVGPPLRQWSDTGLVSLFNLNAFAVGCLMAYIALRFAGVTRGAPERRPDED